MPAGTRYRIPAAENDRSIGVVCVRGGTRHAVDGPTVSLPQKADGLVLNDTAAGWSNGRTPRAIKTAAAAAAARAPISDATQLP